GGALLTISTSGDKFSVKEQYWENSLNNRHGGVILVGDNLYGSRDDGGQLWCVPFATGKTKWSEPDRAKGSGSAAITYADGLLYVRYANGWVSLVDPQDGKQISTFKIPNGSHDCWAHPVVVGGKMYIREQNALWCYDVKGK